MTSKNNLPEDYQYKKIIKQIDDIRGKIEKNSLEKTINNLIKIFSDNHIPGEYIPLFQSKVAFLFSNLTEIWQKDDKNIQQLKKKV